MSDDKVKHPDSVWSFLLSLGKLGWRQLIQVMIVSLVVSIVVLLVATKLFNLRIKDGHISLGVSETTPEPAIVVNATSGWVNTGYHVNKGDKIIIDPTGRVHLAINQAVNVSQIIKPLIIQHTPQRKWLDKIKKRYPPPTLDAQNVFYRIWTGPEGEHTPSDVFENCKLAQARPWGELLFALFKTSEKKIDNEDPIKAFKELGVSPIYSAPHKIEFEAEGDGWIAFIVNDAVMSPDSDSPDSKDFYKAIIEAVGVGHGDEAHKIYSSSLPLFLYNDNLGSFQVTITRNQ